MQEIRTGMRAEGHKIAVGLFASMVLAFASPALLSQVDASPVLPTASEDPAVIDQAWKQANAKYDAQRQQILNQVDRAVADGPFRADWASLQNYEVPQLF